MKKLFKWIADKNKAERKNHPVRFNIVLIVFETIMAWWCGLSIAFGDVVAHPVWGIINFLLLIYWGGLFVTHWTISSEGMPGGIWTSPICKSSV